MSAYAQGLASPLVLAGLAEQAFPFPTDEDHQTMMVATMSDYGQFTVSGLADTKADYRPAATTAAALAAALHVRLQLMRNRSR